MEPVDAAEKEASEVLHSLLSVERIEKQSLINEPSNQQVVVVASADSNSSLNTVPVNSIPTEGQDQNAIQWHTPVTVHQTLFNNIEGIDHTLEGDHVIWQLNQEALTCNQQQDNVCIRLESSPLNSQVESERISDKEVGQKKRFKSSIEKRAPTKRKNKQNSTVSSESAESSRLESSAQEVRERFEKGCECQEENCFVGLNPENVYRHRLNIAELTKGEHDMYLMGVTMAVLTNPEETVRHKERRRLRAQYVFQGRRVCLDAFLYLENCTHYQLKRIRKHVMTHGVAPRVHGNHGKKPHNTFPLDSYQHAAAFLRQFIEGHTSGCNPQQVNSFCKTKTKLTNKNMPLCLPPEITRKTIHNAYRKYCEQCEPSIKVMGYATFKQYMKDQFQYVKFCKSGSNLSKKDNSNQPLSLQHPVHQLQKQSSIQQKQPEEYLPDNSNVMPTEIILDQSSKIQESITTNQNDDHHETHEATIISAAGNMQQVTAIPIVLSQQDNPVVSPALSQVQQQQQQPPITYIVTPVSQLLQASVGTSHTISSNSGNAFTSYTCHLTPANDYSTQQHINQNPVGTLTVASVPSNQYAFTNL